MVIYIMTIVFCDEIGVYVTLEQSWENTKGSKDPFGSKYGNVNASLWMYWHQADWLWPTLQSQKLIQTGPLEND